VALAVDPTFHSPLAAWQIVDTMELDPQGRVLIAGARVYTDVFLIDPVPTGLQRLLANGSLDPGFTNYSVGVRSLFVEAGGTILAGPPFVRMNNDGQVLEQFQTESFDSIITAWFSPLHTAVRLPDGGGLYPISTSISPSRSGLARWSAGEIATPSSIRHSISSPSKQSPSCRTVPFCFH
jgi:hypothetical protein